MANVIKGHSVGLRVRPLAAEDVDEADRICRVAARRGASALVAGANAGRDRAWRVLAGRGFRGDFQGVTMHRPNEPGYSTSDSFVIDDWR